jgi:Ca-activated chloride channel family protein
MRYLKVLVVPIFLLLSPTFTSATYGQKSREISLKVTVTDSHGAVAAGLKQEWFSILENKSRLDITGLETSDEPSAVAILIDLSNSISVKSKKTYVDAVSRFIRTANPNNEYLIIGFNKEIRVIADWGRDQPQIEKSLSDAVQAAAKNGTALYDACNMALMKFPSSRFASHVLLLFSDGQDNASRLSFVKLREQLKQSPAILYAIGLFKQTTDASALSVEGQAVLDELSSVTGSIAYYPESDKALLAVPDQISLELSHEYRIRFRPATTMPDNKWHPVKIKLTLPERDDRGRKFTNLNVRSRDGYYDR